ncbi:MAG TPA: response regulator, partial [Candidatus Cloacimonadota bacterium]|nr:response regulator [Candidatus Cloacimonadota bacterium]
MNKGMLLVVDDEESNVALLKCVLEPKGYHVESANNGKTAIEMYIANDYDLVLLDVMMPGMDGIEACKRMIEYKKNIPIIFLTAINDN